MSDSPRDGFVVLWRNADGVFSYVAPGERTPFVADSPEQLSQIAAERLPADGYMHPDTRYVVSTEFARREFALDV